MDVMTSESSTTRYHITRCKTCGGIRLHHITRAGELIYRATMNRDAVEAVLSIDEARAEKKWCMHSATGCAP